jgi:hypothetical protein
MASGKFGSGWLSRKTTVSGSGVSIFSIRPGMPSMRK